MGMYCSFCDFDPYESGYDDYENNGLICFDCGCERDENANFYLCPDCAEKYGYYECEGCGHSYPVWADLVTETADGRIYCKFCAERFRIKSKLLHGDESKYLKVPKIPTKMYPILIYNIIKHGNGLTKKEITERLDLAVRNKNSEYYLQNGVDHKTVTDGLKILINENNPFHENIVFEEGVYYYKEPKEDIPDIYLKHEKQISTTYRIIKEQLNMYDEIIPMMLVKCIAEKDGDNYFNDLFFVSSYLERLSRLVFGDEHWYADKPNISDYKEILFEHSAENIQEIKYILNKKLKITEADPQKTHKTLWQIADIVCHMMACLTEQAFVKEYAYAIDYVIKNTDSIEKPEMNGLFPTNYKDFNGKDFAPDFPLI